MNQEKKKMNAGKIIGIVFGSIAALIVVLVVAFFVLKPKVYTAKEITSCAKKTATEKVTSIYNTEKVADDITKVQSDFKNKQIDWGNEFTDSLKSCLGVKNDKEILVDKNEKSIDSYVEDAKIVANNKEREIIDNSGLTREKVKSAYLKILATSNSLSDFQTKSANVNTLAKFANVKPFVLLGYFGLHGSEISSIQLELQTEILKKMR